MSALSHPTLERFLASYFHQDWLTDSGSLDAAAQHFVENSSAGATARVREELQTLLDARVPEAAMLEFLAASGVEVDVVRLSGSARQWLRDLASALQSASGSADPSVARADLLTESGDDHDEPTARLGLWIDRSEELGLLHSALQQSGVAVVHGEPGIGKTSLVRQYLERMEAFYSGGVHLFYGDETALFAELDRATLAAFAPSLIVVDELHRASHTGELIDGLRGVAAHFVVITRQRPLTGVLSEVPAVAVERFSASALDAAWPSVLPRQLIGAVYANSKGHPVMLGLLVNQLEAGRDLETAVQRLAPASWPTFGPDEVSTTAARTLGRLIPQTRTWHTPLRGFDSYSALPRPRVADEIEASGLVMRHLVTFGRDTSLHLVQARGGNKALLLLDSTTSPGSSLTVVSELRTMPIPERDSVAVTIRAKKPLAEATGRTLHATLSWSDYLALVEELDSES